MLGSKMEPKIDQKSIIFQVGVPEGPRGRFWKDFGSILELFWDDFWKVLTYINARSHCVHCVSVHVSAEVCVRYRCMLSSILARFFGRKSKV